jgi:hypothetical protein
MRRIGQLNLRLAWTLEQEAEIALGRAMQCQALGCSLLPETCLARQSLDGGRFTYCASGRCQQGLAVQRSLGVARMVRCPTCGGSGEVCEDRMGP